MHDEAGATLLQPGGRHTLDAWWDSELEEVLIA